MRLTPGPPTLTSGLAKIVLARIV